MLQALSRLLMIYPNQVVELYKILFLQRDRETDLFWINTIYDLCNDCV